MVESCERFCAWARVEYKIFQSGPVDSVADLTTVIIVIMGNA